MGGFGFFFFFSLAAQQLLVQVEPFRFCNFKHNDAFICSRAGARHPLHCILCQNLDLFPKFLLLWFTHCGTLRSTLSYRWQLTVCYVLGICYSLCQGFFTLLRFWGFVCI